MRSTRGMARRVSIVLCQKLLRKLPLRKLRRDVQSAEQSLVFLQHVERVARRHGHLLRSAASERFGVDEFLDQIDRGTIIPLQLLLPVPRFLGEQRLDLTRAELAQVHNGHGNFPGQGSNLNRAPFAYDTAAGV